ncbi:MAG: hypothetical protein RIS35_2551 [Pseudomonadota bacterium]
MLETFSFFAALLCTVAIVWQSKRIARLDALVRALAAERDRLVAERDRLRAERDALVLERDGSSADLSRPSPPSP